jgi:hypothetical protein
MCVCVCSIMGSVQSTTAPSDSDVKTVPGGATAPESDSCPVCRTVWLESDRQRGNDHVWRGILKYDDYKREYCARTCSGACGEYETYTCRVCMMKWVCKSNDEERAIYARLFSQNQNGDCFKELLKARAGRVKALEAEIARKANAN